MDQMTSTEIPVTTAFELPGMRIDRHLGTTFGLVVRSMGIAKGIAAGFRALAAGEIPEYTELLEDSRRHAMDRLIENAKILGANAVIAMRFDSSEIGQGPDRDRCLRKRRARGARRDVSMGFVILLGVVALVVVVMLVYRRYGETHARPAGHWRRTEEVFRDPSTGRLMRVWLDPADQSRHYLPDTPSPDMPAPPG
jgi:uncharacterized protein YbjQ (UPF0145 family)